MPRGYMENAMWQARHTRGPDETVSLGTRVTTHIKTTAESCRASSRVDHRSARRVRRHRTGDSERLFPSLGDYSPPTPSRALRVLMIRGSAPETPVFPSARGGDEVHRTLG